MSLSLLWSSFRFASHKRRKAVLVYVLQIVTDKHQQTRNRRTDTDLTQYNLLCFKKKKKSPISHFANRSSISVMLHVKLFP